MLVAHGQVLIRICALVLLVAASCSYYCPSCLYLYLQLVLVVFLPAIQHYKHNTLTASTSSGGRLNRDTRQSKSSTLPDWAAPARTLCFPLQDKTRMYKDKWRAELKASAYCRLGYKAKYNRNSPARKTLAREDKNIIWQVFSSSNLKHLCI